MSFQVTISKMTMGLGEGEKMNPDRYNINGRLVG